MIALIKKELIEAHELFLILHNGRVIDGTFPFSDLSFSGDVSLKVIHIVDTDIELHYEIAADARVKVDELYYRIENNPKISISVHIANNARFDYLSFIKTEDSAIQANVNTFLETGSYINNNTFSIFASESELKHHFYLEGQHSTAQLKNVVINSSGKKQDFSTVVNHNHDETISDFKSYGICNNNSYLNLYSNGIIKKGAKKVELRQKAKGLILDLESKISANPLLEINDYDCIATHGASIGAIDEDELYYLMSRGLTKNESERLIVSSFLIPFLEKIEKGKLQDFIQSWINRMI